MKKLMITLMGAALCCAEPSLAASRQSINVVSYDSTTRTVHLSLPPPARQMTLFMVRDTQERGTEDFGAWDELTRLAVVEAGASSVEVVLPDCVNLETDSLRFVLVDMVGCLPLDSIRGEGAQYINTGYRPTNTAKVVMRIKPSEYASSRTEGFFAAEKYNGGTRLGSFSLFANGGASWRATLVYGNWVGIYKNAAIPENVESEVVANFNWEDPNGIYLAVDGSNWVTAKPEGMAEMEQGSLMVFAQQNGATSYRNFGHFTLFAFEVFEKDGAKKVSLLPCLRDDGVVGVYDRVTGTFPEVIFTTEPNDGFTPGKVSLAEVNDLVAGYSDLMDRRMVAVDSFDPSTGTVKLSFTAGLVGKRLLVAWSNHDSGVLPAAWERVQTVTDLSAAATSLTTTLPAEFRCQGMVRFFLCRYAGDEGFVPTPDSSVALAQDAPGVSLRVRRKTAKVTVGLTATDSPGRLFLASGKGDFGTKITDWPCIAYLGTAAAGTERTLVFDYPEDLGQDETLCYRLFYVMPAISNMCVAESLTSRGGTKQWIDTGIVPDASLDLKFDWYQQRPNSNEGPLGYIGVYCYFNNGGFNAFDFMGVRKQQHESIVKIFGARHEVQMNIDGVWLDGSVLFESFAGTEKTTKHTFPLFMVRDSAKGTIPDSHSNDITFYSVSMGLGGVPVRSFLPCVIEGEPQFYDRVSRTLFKNKGDGSFVAGEPVVSELPPVGAETLVLSFSECQKPNRGFILLLK